MTGEGNVCMAPSPVVIAPGEPTKNHSVDSRTKMNGADISTPLAPKKDGRLRISYPPDQKAAVPKDLDSSG